MTRWVAPSLTTTVKDNSMDEQARRLLRHAVRLLRAGYPLPVDLTARLLEAGVDVAVLDTTAKD